MKHPPSTQSSPENEYFCKWSKVALGSLPLRIIMAYIQTLIVFSTKRIHDDVYKKTLFAYTAIKKKDEKRLRFTDFLGPTEVEPTSHKPT